MAEDLQALLERIRREGIEKAQAEAARILEAAREQASALLRDAEQKAAEHREQARLEQERWVEQGKRTLEQAARDAIFWVRAALERLLQEWVREEVSAIAQGETLRQWIERAIERLSAGSATAAVEIYVPESEAQELRAYLLRRSAERFREGITIRGDRSLRGGFRVRVADGRVEHDWSDEAMAELLMSLLRPALAERVAAALGRNPSVPPGSAEKSSKP